MKNVSIDALNRNLFETIEMLKNRTDPKASENERMDVDTAKAIADISKVIIDGYKVKTQVLGMLRNCGNPTAMSKMAVNGGIIEDDQLALVETIIEDNK